MRSRELNATCNWVELTKLTGLCFLRRRYTVIYFRTSDNINVWKKRVGRGSYPANWDLAEALDWIRVYWNLDRATWQPASRPHLILHSFPVTSLSIRFGFQTGIFPTSPSRFLSPLFFILFMPKPGFQIFQPLLSSNSPFRGRERKEKRNSCQEKRLLLFSVGMA